MKGFPVEISRDGHFVRAQAIDVPLAFAVGTSIEHALRQMPNAINRGLRYHTKEGRRLPLPSAASGRRVVRASLAWRIRLVGQQWHDMRARLKRRLAPVQLRLHRGSQWSMPAFDTAVPCTLLLA